MGSKNDGDWLDKDRPGFVMHEPYESAEMTLADQLAVYFLAGKVTCEEGSTDPRLYGILFDGTSLPYPSSQSSRYDPDYHHQLVQRRLQKGSNEGWNSPQNDICNLSPQRRGAVSYTIKYIWEQIAGKSDRAAPQIDSANFNSLLTQDFIQQEVLQNHHTYELKRLDSRLNDLAKQAQNPALKQLLDFSKVVRQSLEAWFYRIGIPPPERPTSSMPFPRKTLKQEYRDLCNYYYDTPGADPVEARRVLTDKTRWKNHSTYLHPWRKKRKIPIARLKEHPCFTWADPKGLSNDDFDESLD